MGSYIPFVDFAMKPPPMSVSVFYSAIVHTCAPVSLKFLQSPSIGPRGQALIVCAPTKRSYVHRKYPFYRYCDDSYLLVTLPLVSSVVRVTGRPVTLASFLK